VTFIDSTSPSKIASFFASIQREARKQKNFNKYSTILIEVPKQP